MKYNDQRIEDICRWISFLPLKGLWHLSCDSGRLSGNNKVFIPYFSFTPPAGSTSVAPLILRLMFMVPAVSLKDPCMELVEGSEYIFRSLQPPIRLLCIQWQAYWQSSFQNLMPYIWMLSLSKSYRKEEIFHQEGWNYQLEDLDAPLNLSSVVYNRMRAFSLSQMILQREILACSFQTSM